MSQYIYLSTDCVHLDCHAGGDDCCQTDACLCVSSTNRDPSRSRTLAAPQATEPACRGEVRSGPQQPPEICLVRPSPTLRVLSPQKWDMCSRLWLSLDALQDPPLHFLHFSLIIFAVLFKNLAASFLALKEKKIKKKSLERSLTLIPHMVASLPTPSPRPHPLPHPVMLKGFYKHWAKAAS